jgi:uncharacterized membrane protein
MAWKSTDGAENAGAVLFQALGPTKTEVTLRLDAEPDGPIEAAGDALGFLQRRVHGDLERFKEHVDGKGGNGKAWRGEIHGADIERDASGSAAR